MKELTIKWDSLAKSELKKIYSIYKKKSIQGAENVKKDIFEATDKLKNPNVKYITDPNLGRPYHFIMARKRYRIIYRREETAIRIVFVFDTKQKRDKLNKIRASK